MGIWLRRPELIGEAESGASERAGGAHVWAQAGGYNVSVPELDMLVDLSLGAEGVVGAGLMGRRLGGSMIALVRTYHWRSEMIDLPSGR